MKILVIGSGGREHAVAAKFLVSPDVTEVYVAPGNPGMKRTTGITLVDISASDTAALVRFATTHDISFTFVGPEVPLMDGIADAFEAEGLRIFGPKRDAALIEGSKDFAKKIMVKYGIPTAEYATFEDLAAAVAYVREQGAPIVIKADGLAAGKGVTVAQDIETAITALEHIFSEPGGKVVIEECLVGEEFSLFSFVHGTDFYTMPIAQDHKRAFDGDTGPNTGGMGAYCPVANIPQSAVDEAIDRVVRPAVLGLAAEGRPFTGILYAGLMLTADGVKTIEFNARFGDPETQVVLPRLTTDFAHAIDDILDGREPELAWLEGGVTIGVVVASNGYPGSYENGHALPEIPSNLDVFYAGTAEKEGTLVSHGGRVYLVSRSGATLGEAQHALYGELDRLDNAGLFYRHDIGNRGIQ